MKAVMVGYRGAVDLRKDAMTGDTTMQPWNGNG